MIVPVVGDFAGPVRSGGVGDHIRQHGGVLAAFYGSNVEVYLNRQEWPSSAPPSTTLHYDWRTGSSPPTGCSRLRPS